MKLLKTTVCLLSFVCLIHADLDYSCYNILNRGEAFYLNMDLPNIGVETARHHVLRFDRIRTFFNLALHYNNHVRRELIEMSLQLLENAHQYFDSSNRLAYRIAWEQLDANFQLPQKSTNEWITEAQENNSIFVLHALWTWMPFNYVVGPRHRSDDNTQSNLDLPTMNIIGRNNFENIERLNRAINSFANAPYSSTGVVCIFACISYFK